MSTFAEKAKSITRRGDLLTRQEPTGTETTTWLVTASDDVVATNIRDGKAAVISATDIAEVINESAEVARVLEELNSLSGIVTAARVREIIKGLI